MLSATGDGDDGAVVGISRLWVSMNWQIKGRILSAKPGAETRICFMNSVMTVA